MKENEEIKLKLQDFVSKRTFFMADTRKFVTYHFYIAYGCDRSYEKIYSNYGGAI